MEAALRTLLLSSDSLTELVGDRVSWGRRNRTDALPAVVLHRIDNQPDYVMEGPSGLKSGIIQVDCFADTYSAAINTKNAVISLVSGYLGDISSIRWQGIFVTGERDLSDEGTAADEVLFRISIDLNIWYGEI